ncbi:MAG: M20/M25/M40 family metallo-hydrolase [Clostridia bacterium]
MSLTDALSRVREERVVDLMMEICRADSAPLKEGPVFHIVKRALIELGFEVHEDDAGRRLGGEVGNLIATKPGQGGGEGWPPVMFSAHLDRVEGGTGVRPRVVDGRVRSDGSTILGADDAAGLAAIVEACRALAESGAPAAPIELVLTIGEEIGLVGAAHADLSRLRSKTGFVLDADGPVGTIITAAPTQYTIEAEFFGRAAHAGMAPERGISAIKMAALAVSRMRLGRIDADTTANVGYIAGGGATNIVPERATIRAEARSLERERVERQVAHMIQAIDEAARSAGGSARWNVQLEYEGFRLDPDAEPVRRAVRAAESLGLAPRLKSTGGGSDANIFNAKGIPTAVLGVGYEAIHTREESMPVDQLVLLARMVVALASAPGA